MDRSPRDELIIRVDGRYIHFTISEWQKIGETCTRIYNSEHPETKKRIVGKIITVYSNSFSIDKNSFGVVYDPDGNDTRLTQKEADRLFPV